MLHLCLWWLLGSTLTLCATEAQAPNRFTQMEKIYQQVFEGEELSYNKQKSIRKILEEQKSGIFPLPSFDEKTINLLALQKIKKSFGNNDPVEMTPVLTKAAWSDLDLFANKDGLIDGSILSAIARTETASGRIMLTRLLVDPTVDATVLKKRQAFVQRLIDDRELFEQLNHLIEKVAKEEASLLSFDTPSELIKQRYIQLFYVLNQVSGLQQTVGIIFATGLAPLMGLSSAASLAGGVAEAFKKNYPDAAVKAGGGILIGGLGSLLTWVILGKMKTVAKFNVYIQRRAASVRTLLKAAAQCADFFKESDLPELQEEYKNYTRYLENTNTDELETIVKDPIFKVPHDGGFNSYKKEMFRMPGKTKDAFAALLTAMPHAANMLTLVGHLDAYLSIAKLFMERQSTRAPYCFVSFATEEKKPWIRAHNFHHPLVPLEHTVLNSIALGCDGIAPNVLITGVNGGGKSTVMRSIALCCILGQSLGIAPAQSCTLTPFSRIRSYFNITDDVSADLSLFRSELKRAQVLLHNIQAMNPGEFSITFLDEIFTGTEHVEGEALTYATARKLGLLTNNITLLASHFPALAELAKTHQAHYVNMRVVIERDAKGNFIYPFLLSPGHIEQNIAPELLEKRGLPQRMTDKMREVLNNPHTYTPAKDLL